MAGSKLGSDHVTHEAFPPVEINYADVGLIKG